MKVIYTLLILSVPAFANLSNPNLNVGGELLDVEAEKLIKGYQQSAIHRQCQKLIHTQCRLLGGSYYRMSQCTQKVASFTPGYLKIVAKGMCVLKE
jgi:hypothetical protein